MADPKKPTDPFLVAKSAVKSGSTKKTSDPFLVAKAAASGKKAKAAEVNPIVSAGQSLLGVLTASGAATVGLMNEVAKQGKTGQGDLLKALGAGSQNFTAAIEGKPTVAFQDYLRTTGVIGKKNSGSLIEEGTPAAFVAGLAGDIIFDPLNIIPGKMITNIVKLPALTAKAAIKGGIDAGVKGIVSTERAIQAVGAETKAGKTLAETAVQTQPLKATEKLYKTGRKYVADETTAGATYRAAIEKPAYTAVKIEAPRSAAETVNQIVGSAFDAGKAALTGTISADNAIETIAKFARKEAKQVRKNRKLGIITEGKTALDDGTTTLVNGEVVTFPRYTPWAADNGKVYVSNGANTYSFPTEAAAQKFITNAGEKIAETITGVSAPIVDTANLAIPFESLIKIPTTKKEAKDAQQTLKTIDKLAQGAIATATKVEGKTVEPVTYTGFTSLIEGLKAGHSIDSATLENIVDTLDPSRAWVADTKDLSKKKTVEFLKNLLVTDGAQTAAKVQERLDLMNASTILKAQGVSYSETAATYIAAKLDPRLSEDIESATNGIALSEILGQAREAAANRINTARIENPRQFGRVTNAINRAFTTRFEGIDKIENQENFWAGITNLGDMAVRTGEAAWGADSRAILKLQVNQMFQTSMVGSLLGTASNKPAATRMLQLIDDMKLASDSMSSVLGSRFVQIKVQDPNLKKMNVAHFAFFHLGDVMEAFTASGKKGQNLKGQNLILKGFFPEGEEIVRETDSLSFQGITEAVRYMMEMTELNKPILHEELVRKIASRGTGQKAATETFMAQVPKLAEDIAKHLETNPQVFTMIKEAHKTRLLAAADEALVSAETLTEDLFSNMIDAYRQVVGKGSMDDAERIAIVKELFGRFTYLSGAFRNQSTEVGESVLRTAAMMYISGGKLKDLVTKKALDGGDLISDTKEASAILDTIHNLYRTDGPAALTNKLGYEHLPKPDKKAVENVTEKLNEVEILYAKHRNELAAVTNKTEYTKWENKMLSLQRRIDSWRAKADKLSVNTRYWTNEGWKNKALFDQELEIATTEKVAQYPDGSINMGELAVDTAPVRPKKLTAEQERKVLREWADKNVVEQMNLRTSDAEEAASSVLLRQQEIEAKWADEADQAEVIVQMYNSEKLHRSDTVITRAQLMDKNKYMGQGVAGKASPTNLSKGAALTFARRAGEYWNRTTGKELSSAYLIKAQSQLNQATQSAAHYMTSLMEKYAKVVGQKDLDTAVGYAIANKIPANTSPEMAELTQDIAQALKAFFGDNGAIVASGIDGEILQASFNRYGLAGLGMPDVTTMTPKELGNLIKELPYGKGPSKKNPLERKLWEDRRAVLEAANENPFMVFSRIIQAIEHAKLEKNLVQNWSEEFSYLKEFPNLSKEAAYNEAVRQGYVRIKLNVGDGKTNLAKHLPKPEDGGLYHPLLANEFAAMNREINKLYNSNKMPDFVNTMMEILNILKFTQTTAAPRHHVTNIVSDFATTIIGGARDVRQMAYSMKLSYQWALNRAQIDYKLFADLAKKDQQELGLARAMRNLQGTPNKLMGKEGEPLVASAVIGGKVVSFDDTAFTEGLEQWAIMVGQQQLSDLKGLQETAQILAGNGARGQMWATVGEKLHKATTKFERPFGDFAAAYGNAPRINTAMAVMQSRSWKSEAEMWAAMAEKVHTLHPTTYSLSASERRYPRLLANYYTWLRGAHNAFLYMAMNHTAATTVYSKVQYNLAETQGLEPTSISTPWGDKSKSPSYLNYSVYGPTAMGPNGPTLFKPSILPLDVIDTWNIQFDPTIPFDQQVVGAVQNVGQGVIGKNINMLLQPGFELVTRTDPSTGRPTKIKDLATLTDKAMSMIGTTSLLKGLGIYTPSDKGIDAANPLTDRQRELLLSNFLGLTMKAQDVNTTSNVKNAKTEANARTKRILEQLLNQQETK